jgi:hypothetical protein
MSEQSSVRQLVDEQEHKQVQDKSFIQTFELLYKRIYLKGRDDIPRIIRQEQDKKQKDEEYYTLAEYKDGKVIVNEIVVDKYVPTSEEEDMKIMSEYMNHINDMIRKLIVGQNLNVANENNMTPLLIICDQHILQSDIYEKIIVNNICNLVKLFVENGADVNAMDSDNTTALMYICVNNSFNDISEIIKLLVELKADVNLTDKWGKTALHYASNPDACADIKVIDLLLDLGVNPDIKDCNGEDYIDYMDGETARHVYRNVIKKIKMIQSVKTCINEGYKAQDAIMISYLNESSISDK